MGTRLQYRVEYALTRAIAGLANLLPYRAALVVAWMLAVPSFWLSAKRQRRAERRLQQVFGDRFSRRERIGIAWRAWRNLCFNAVETMRVPSITLEWVKEVTEYGAVGNLTSLLNAGTGVVIAVPHMGNWEFAGVAGQLFCGKMMTIVRRQKNPLINDFLNRMRAYTGMETIFREAKSFAGVVRKLQEGKALAIPVDLRAKGASVRVRYLGVETDIPAGAATFARQANVPILPAYVTRQGWARHVWHTCDPVRPDPAVDRDADIVRMTQQVMDLFDAAVREHPDQYFWFNKRWVLGEEPAS